MRKNFKRLLLCLLFATILPIQTIASETVTEPEIIELSEAEAEYYWDLYRRESGITQYSEFTDTDLALLKSDGKLMVLYSTSYHKLASEIGTKQILLEVKDGLFWSALAAKTKEYTTNDYIHTGGFYYTKPVSGSNYRVSGVHFAVVDGKEITRYASTGSFTYN